MAIKDIFRAKISQHSFPVNVQNTRTLNWVKHYRNKMDGKFSYSIINRQMYFRFNNINVHKIDR